MSQTTDTNKPNKWRFFRISIVLHGVGLFGWLLMFGLLVLSITRSDAPTMFMLMYAYPVIVLVVHAISFFLIRSGNQTFGNGLLALPFLWGCATVTGFTMLLFTDPEGVSKASLSLRPTFL